MPDLHRELVEDLRERVQDLLEANNRYLERARVAEQKVGYMSANLQMALGHLDEHLRYDIQDEVLAAYKLIEKALGREG